MLLANDPASPRLMVRSRDKGDTARSDIAARLIIPPQDMSVGVLTGAVGGLFFIDQMRCRKAGTE